MWIALSDLGRPPRQVHEYFPRHLGALLGNEGLGGANKPVPLRRHGHHWLPELVAPEDRLFDARLLLTPSAPIVSKDAMQMAGISVPVMLWSHPFRVHLHQNSSCARKSWSLTICYRKTDFFNFSKGTPFAGPVPRIMAIETPPY